MHGQAGRTEKDQEQKCQAKLRKSGCGSLHVSTDVKKDKNGGANTTDPLRTIFLIRLSTLGTFADFNGFPRCTGSYGYMGRVGGLGGAVKVESPVIAAASGTYLESQR